MVVGPVDVFFLEGVEERLGGGVVSAYPGPAYGLADAMCLAELGCSRRCVLGAAVGVEHHTLYLAASG